MRETLYLVHEKVSIYKLRRANVGGRVLEEWIEHIVSDGLLSCVLDFDAGNEQRLRSSCCVNIITIEHLKRTSYHVSNHFLANKR